MNKIISLFVTLVILLSACGSAAPGNDPFKLKIAVIPVIDTLPMFVAQAEGLFQKHGVQVEFVPVASAPERDQLLQAGQADGALNETLAIMFFNKDKIQLQAVRYGHMASPGSGHFFIMASGKSGISTMNGLKGIEIGVSQGTIIDYVTTRLLEKAGFAAEDIKTISVPKIPDRMSLLASGTLQAAVMPDPLAALAVQQGAKIILDDTSNPTLGASVISFRKSIIDSHPDKIKAFLAAIEEAVNLINADPSKYSSLLVEKKIVPQPLIGKYVTPKFPTKGIPSEAEWKDVLAWARDKGLLSADVSYKDSVNPAFLP
jgi:NitT/TauT family transport system substrate-binding protein